jgi:hypothetical protein
VKGLLVGGALKAGATDRLAPLTAIAPMDLRVLILPQVGQSWASLDCDMRNFRSNGCSQSRQTKVYMGICRICSFLHNILLVSIVAAAREFNGFEQIFTEALQFSTWQRLAFAKVFF